MSVVAAVVAALCAAGGVLAAWTESTLYEAESFSRRSVAALGSEAVRHEIALQLTDQLVQSGNREVTAFRPAAVLAAETLVDTDTFKAIFATSMRRTHSALLSGSSGAALDLSDSLSLLSTSLRLTGEAKAAERGTTASTTLPDVITHVSKLRVWKFRSEIERSVSLLLWTALGATIVSVLVAVDRRGAAARLGLGLGGAGLLVWAVAALSSRLAKGLADEPQLRRATQDAVWAVTSDLRVVGISMMIVGLVVFAAARTDARVSLASARQAVEQRIRRIRSTALGSIVLAIVLGVIGVSMLVSPAAAAETLAIAVGLAFVYAATRVVVSLATPVVEEERGDGAPMPTRHRLVWAGVGAGLVAIAVAVTVVQVRSARSRAEATYELRCMGEVDLCARRLDEVTLAGAHNAMSAAAYPGWLFAEQTGSLGSQLRSGVRALLIDAHYGRKSSVKVPGAGVPLVITDIAAEYTVPGAEVADAGLRARAEQLAASAPIRGRAKRDVYLCHNYCELGAVRMADALRPVAKFLDENPGEIVTLIVQDAVSSADVATAISEAGLRDKAAVLRRGETLPTLGDLVEAGTPLLVFAERGDDRSPEWYPRAYDFFQETGYTFTSLDAFDCAPNRGRATNRLLLVNHWVNRSPPDPATARRANSAGVLQRRVQRCLDERGLLPTVIAADFATSGQLIATAADITRHPEREPSTTSIP